MSIRLSTVVDVMAALARKDVSSRMLYADDLVLISEAIDSVSNKF